jgi:hypothetical protein
LNPFDGAALSDEAFMGTGPADRTAGSIRGATIDTSFESMRAPANPPMARRGRAGAAMVATEERRRSAEGSAAPWKAAAGDARERASAPRRTGFDTIASEEGRRFQTVI